MVRVRISRVPPSRVLEGVDLRDYRLQEGREYELDPRVAKILVAWNYAEPADDCNDSGPKSN
jgi:hypothetical protein